jgi:hypothetical protein
MPLTPTRLVINPELRKHERKIPKRYFCGHINIYITLVLPITAHWITMGMRYPFQRWSKRYGKDTQVCAPHWLVDDGLVSTRGDSLLRSSFMTVQPYHA